MRRRSFETVLVGPSALVREGLTRILCAANFHIVSSALRIDDADLTSLTQHNQILLIVDSGDNAEAAVEQVERFREQYTDARIAILADTYRLEHVVSAFEAGVDAYFVKVANWDAFIKSLELVMLGEMVLPPAILPSILSHEPRREDEPIGHDFSQPAKALHETEHDDTPPLSTREKCILHHLIEGHSNKAIARKIDIAEATVKVHVKTILRKIRVQNRTQAAIWAINNAIQSSHKPPGMPIRTDIPNRDFSLVPELAK